MKDQKLKLFVMIVLISIPLFLIVVILFYQLFVLQKQNIANEVFIESLQGEVVYTHENEGVSSVYKILANGRNNKLIYRNVEKNTYNLNTLLPKWSDDGSKIYFTAMKNDEWKRISINPDGTGAIIEMDMEPLLNSERSRDKDILIENGSVFYRDLDGNKVSVYQFKYYDAKFNVGASEASWSPDKKFIIFQSCKFIGGCSILVSNRDGTNVVEIAKGKTPDWKF